MSKSFWGRSPSKRASYPTCSLPQQCLWRCWLQQSQGHWVLLHSFSAPLSCNQMLMPLLCACATLLVCDCTLSVPPTGLRIRDVLRHPAVSHQTERHDLCQVIKKTLQAGTVRQRQKFLSKAQQMVVVHEEWKQFARFVSWVEASC